MWSLQCELHTTVSSNPAAHWARNVSSSLWPTLVPGGRTIRHNMQLLRIAMRKWEKEKVHIWNQIFVHTSQLLNSQLMPWDKLSSSHIFQKFILVWCICVFEYLYLCIWVFEFVYLQFVLSFSAQLHLMWSQKLRSCSQRQKEEGSGWIWSAQVWGIYLVYVFGICMYLYIFGNVYFGPY